MKISQSLWEKHIVISCLFICVLFFLAAVGIPFKSLVWVAVPIILNLLVSIYIGLKFVK